MAQSSMLLATFDISLSKSESVAHPTLLGASDGAQSEGAGKSLELHQLQRIE